MDRTCARRRLFGALLGIGLVGLLLFPAGAAAGRTPKGGAILQVNTYRVDGVSTKEDRSAIERTGTSIEIVGSNYVLVRATGPEISKVLALGYHVSGYVEPNNFPGDDAKYHNYREMAKDIAAEVAAHPGIIREFSIGKSYEGRKMLAVKISDNVNKDENEPEVLFDTLHHAREHLVVEEGLAIMHQFVDKYGVDPKITKLVNTREIWILHEVNPDGGQFDIQGGSYHFWRKNRQPNQGSPYIGTDLNRNYSYQWGCCGGSSGDPSSEVYRGPSPFSAPETQAIRDFVKSRVIGGKQQIVSSISFHTYGQLILWPYGYTYQDVPPDMTQDDHDVFVAMGQAMAATTCQNGDCYTPQQASDLYITDGDSIDWQYGTQGIFAANRAERC